MFEDLWGDVALFVRDFQSWSPSSTTHYTIIFVSVLAAVVLSRIVAGTPVLIGPLSFAILYLMATARHG